MDTGAAIEVWDAVITVPVAGHGDDAYPVVRALRARASAETVAKLLARWGLQGHLVEGGVEVTVKLPVSHVKVALLLSAAANGRLRIEVAAASLASRLSIPGWTLGLGMALARIEKRPGIYRVATRTLEVEVRELLSGSAAHVPVRWQTRIHRAEATRESVEIECSE